MSEYQLACAWSQVQKIQVEHRARTSAGDYQKNLSREWLKLLYALLN